MAHLLCAQLLSRPLSRSICVISQIVGCLLAMIGWIVALINFDVFGEGGEANYRAHGYIGNVIMSLTLLQPINAWLRPHKSPGEPRTPVRLAWEIVHKVSGYGALLLAVVNIAIGVQIVGIKEFAPAYAATWAFVIVVGATLAVDKKVNASSGVEYPPKGTGSAEMARGAV